MDKPYSVTFNLDAKILSVLYICWKYKFPLSFMLTFYEMYGEQSLFIFKAMACTKKITLNDNTFIKIIEESRNLNNQILKGISTNLKINTLTNKVKNGKKIEEIIPEKPVINITEFSEDYKKFISEYLVKNIKNIFSEKIELKLNTADLYAEIL